MVCVNPFHTPLYHIQIVWPVGQNEWLALSSMLVALGSTMTGISKAGDLHSRYRVLTDKARHLPCRLWVKTRPSSMAAFEPKRTFGADPDRIRSAVERGIARRILLRSNKLHPELHSQIEPGDHRI